MVTWTGRRTSARNSLPPPLVSAVVLPCTALPWMPGSILTVMVVPAEPLIASVTLTWCRLNRLLRVVTAFWHGLVQVEPTFRSCTDTVVIRSSEGRVARREAIHMGENGQNDFRAFEAPWPRTRTTAPSRAADGRSAGRSGTRSFAWALPIAPG